MRFSKLHLDKFGMFANTVLDVSDVGVNVIVGRNEAGKSTAMNAVSQLLFGIPTQSAHNYLHNNADLRIGGTFVGADGKSVEIYRVKKSGPSLRNPDGEVVGDDVLLQLLGGVNKGLFTELFSISHDEIAQGGAALLGSEGELGAALFGAGTGLTTLNAVLAKLNSMAGDLFKPSGSNPTLNVDLTRYKELTASVKDATQSAKEVDALNTALSAEEKAKTTKEEELKGISLELHKAERVRRSRVLLSKLRNANDELANLESQGPRADPQIPAYLSQATQDRFKSNASIAELDTALATLDPKLKGLIVDEQLIAQSNQISALNQEIGTLRVNFKDLPSLNKQVGDLKRDLQGLLRQVPDECRKDAAGKPYLTAVESSRVKRMVESRGALEPALEAARTVLADNEQILSREEANLSSLREPVDVVNLTAAVARIRQDGKLEAGIANLDAEAVRLVATISAALNSVGLRYPPRDADAIPIPDSASVLDIDTSVTEARNELAAANIELDRLKKERAAAVDELQSLIREAAPPSSAELATERSRRDSGWQLVRASWLGHETTKEDVEVWTSGEPLDQVFAASIASTDAIADRMLGDAHSVEKRSFLEQQITNFETFIVAQEGIVNGRRNALDTAFEHWNGLWARLAIETGDRKAMDNLLNKVKTSGANALQLRDLDRQLTEQQAIVDAAKVDLRLLLTEAGDSPDAQLTLAALLDRADAISKQANDNREARNIAQRAADAAAKSVKSAATKLHASEKALADWLIEWTAALGPLGLPADTKANDVSDLLAAIYEVNANSTGLDRTERRVAGIERRNKEIADELQAVLARLSHLEIDNDDPTTVIGALKEQLDAALQVRTQRVTLEKERDEKIAERDIKQGTLAKADTEIRQLVAQSNLADEEALRSAVARTESATELERSVAQWKDELLSAAGVPLGQVEREVDELADAELDERIEELSSRQDALRKELNDILLSVGGLRRQFDEIDESDKAALAAEQAQATVARLRGHADDYVRVVLAKQLLEREIEEYRQRNQGPILGRASKLFERLTLQRYAGFETDTDEKGKVVLHAKTASGSQIEVSKLSTGTRDQLYLALRLAALEHVTTKGQSVPLLLDDLFVHFDDERTKAGLQVLDELSSSMQILLFTHHERVAEQASSSIRAERLTVLRLSPPV